MHHRPKYTERTVSRRKQLTDKTLKEQLQGEGPQHLCMGNFLCPRFHLPVLGLAAESEVKLWIRYVSFMYN